MYIRLAVVFENLLVLINTKLHSIMLVPIHIQILILYSVIHFSPSLLEKLSNSTETISQKLSVEEGEKANIPHTLTTFEVVVSISF